MRQLLISELTKTYKGSTTPALNNFTYTFDHGIYGLIGPNGAGKTTLMNLIAGILKPDKGSIMYGESPILSSGAFYRSVLGYMPQQQQLYSMFTVKRFLYYFAALKGLGKKEAKKRIEELIILVNLSESADKKLSALSGGMKQRVLLVQALLNDPEILIMDEPTAGLDPGERMNIRNHIYNISQNKTVIISTHVISDIEQIAREVIFLKEGECVLFGTPEEVISKVSRFVWETEVSVNEYSLLQRQYKACRVVGERYGRVTLKLISAEQPKNIETKRAAVSLEDVYYYLYT